MCIGGSGVCMCVCVGGGGGGGRGGGWLVGASFTSDFHHVRLTRNFIPVCK